MVVIVNRVIELPIRDGNNIIEECLKFNKRVIELPIRDGNADVLIVLDALLSVQVIELPIRDGNMGKASHN